MENLDTLRHTESGDIPARKVRALASSNACRRKEAREVTRVTPRTNDLAIIMTVTSLTINDCCQIIR